MSQQGEHSELENYPRSQRIFPRWSTVWKVVGVLVVLGAGVLYLGWDISRHQSKFWARYVGRSLSMAGNLYASDNNDVLPSAQNWESTLDDYWREARQVECNAWFWDGRKTRFAMNGNLSGVNMKTIKDPSVVPIFFLSTLPGPSAVGGEKDVAYNEEGKALVGCLDMRSGTLKKADVARLLWTAPFKSPAK